MQNIIKDKSNVIFLKNKPLRISKDWNHIFFCPFPKINSGISNCGKDERFTYNIGGE